jgi:hypothetical protein
MQEQRRVLLIDDEETIWDEGTERFAGEPSFRAPQARNLVSLKRGYVVALDRIEGAV